MSVTVRAKLPKGDGNGLASWERKLAENPGAAIPVVALLRADTIEARPHDEDDPQVVKCVFVGIEAVGDAKAAAQVETLVRDAYQARTGRLALPFEDEGTDD
jgi:hypothetical protein